MRLMIKLGPPRRQRNSPAVLMRVLGSIALLSLLAGVLVSALAAPLAGLAGMATKDATQTFDALKVPALGRVPSRSELLDANGKLIAYYYPNYIYRVPVTYQQISPSMRDAAVAIEDSRFYHHGAIDIRGTLRAMVADLTGSQVQGGSTIAQQYVKNALLLTASTNAQRQAAVAQDAARKIIELRIAAAVEHEMTLNQLLAAYLNVAYFENEAYGVQVAAARYFSTTAARLTLPQAAMLAGLVQNPARYDPLVSPGAALARRNVVLARMAQLHYVSRAAAAAAERSPLALHTSAISMQQGCYSASARTAAWFCDYVLAELRTNPAYHQAWTELNTIGGLHIYTTMEEQDQRSAQNAVNFMLPAPPSGYNPGRNAAAEVLIQPGTGYIRAIAVDRPYGTGHNQDSIDYAVDTAQNGGEGVQTGSSSKLFTLITALKQGVPFGYSRTIVSPNDIGPFYNCKGEDVGGFPVANAEGAGKGRYTLYTATTQSINVFFAELEQKVGLCNVVKTAVSMGVHRADGLPPMQAIGKPGSPGYQLPADDISSFTLGSVNVSPLSMAGAYATVASGGIYCTPMAITAITASDGQRLPVQARSCHRAISKLVAEAATYILKGVLTSGTAKGDGVTRNGVYIPQAGKTGTANSFEFAAFGGYTPRLAGYVSMFNPTDPVTHPMVGSASCYRSSGGGQDCPGSIFGANAGQIWQMTFESADLGRGVAYFPSPPGGSGFFREGTGRQSPAKARRAKARPARAHHA
jgi:membrane peptidoglycan carboxypeptidase